jgi:hypothetical protein
MSPSLRTGGGQRQTWTDLPLGTRARVEARLGAPVGRADSQPGGFSPGVASHLTTITGETVFLKAVSPVPNPDSPRFHRQEALVAAQLPVAAPVPRLRWSLDEGPDGWVVLVFDAVDGRMPALPWDNAELSLVLAAVDSLAETLTPSPVPETVVCRVAEIGSSASATGRASEATRHSRLTRGPVGTSRRWSRWRPISPRRRPATRWSIWTCALTTSSSPSGAWWWWTGRAPGSARRGSTSFASRRRSRCRAARCRKRYSPGAPLDARRRQTRCGRPLLGSPGSSLRCRCCPRCPACRRCASSRPTRAPSPAIGWGGSQGWTDRIDGKTVVQYEVAHQ